MAKAAPPNPFVGPRPFSKSERHLFFGRDKDLDNALSLVIAYPILLLYAQSGAGKTSFLNAGIMPLLEEEGFQILPVARVTGFIPPQIQSRTIVNPFVLNTLMSWTRTGDNVEQLAQLSLPSYLNELERPTSSDGLPAPRVAVFDQFEELFTSFPEHWKDRQGLLEQIRDMLEIDPLLRVILAIREEYIAQLDPYAGLLPDKMRIRFRLERLREDSARAAIEGSLAEAGLVLEQGATDRLINELRMIRVQTPSGDMLNTPGEFVEPVQLQIAGHELWERLPAQAKLISSNDLGQASTVDQALAAYYDASVRAAAQATGMKEIEIRVWIEHALITANGTRGIVAQGKDETAGIPNAVLDTLENQHIIRAEERGGLRWYELTHDRIIAPIQKANQVALR